MVEFLVIEPDPPLYRRYMPSLVKLGLLCLGAVALSIAWHHVPSGIKIALVVAIPVASVIVWPLLPGWIADLAVVDDSRHRVPVFEAGLVLGLNAYPLWVCWNGAARLWQQSHLAALAPVGVGLVISLLTWLYLRATDRDRSPSRRQETYQDRLARE